MNVRRLAVAGAVLALTLVPASSGAATLLHASVGPYRTIQLQDAQGAPVQKVKAGAIAFRIEDRSSTLNFCLKGPGVNRALTGVKFTGTKTVTLRLRKGAYTYYDRSQPRAMRGTFRVV